MSAEAEREGGESAASDRPEMSEGIPTTGETTPERPLPAPDWTARPRLTLAAKAAVPGPNADSTTAVETTTASV